MKYCKNRTDISQDQRYKVNGIELDFSLYHQVSDLLSYKLKFPSKISSPQFWKVLEKDGLYGVNPYYVLISDSAGCPLGICYFQIKYFRASESLQWKVPTSLWKQLKQSLQKEVASLVRFPTLVAGNLCMTGPYGTTFTPWEKQELYAEVIKWTTKELRHKGISIQATLVKDFERPLSILKEEGFTEFDIQPSMNVEIRPEWNEVSDYFQAMRSKYRKRMRKARNRRQNLNILVENGSEITDAQCEAMYSLYQQRARSASFNIASLKETYFSTLSAIWQEEVVHLMYYHENELIGFMTVLFDEQELYAQFTGFQEDKNKQYDIYLNLLLDVVELGIRHKKEKLHFARTAMEIKSSIGAQPVHHTCYFKFDHPLIQPFVPLLIRYLEPKETWHQRHPFKESNTHKPLRK